MNWNKLSGTKSIYADVPGCGRYLIRWSKDDGAYRAFLNNKRTAFAAAKRDDVQKMVERVVRALDQMEEAGAVTVSFPEIQDGDDG